MRNLMILFPGIGYHCDKTYIILWKKDCRNEWVYRLY